MGQFHIVCLIVLELLGRSVVGSVGRSVDAAGHDVNGGGGLMMMQLLLMVQQRPIDGVNYDGGGY